MSTTTRAALMAVLCCGAAAQNVQMNGQLLAQWAANDAVGRAFGVDGQVSFVPGWLAHVTVKYFHVGSFGGATGGPLTFLPSALLVGGGSGPQGRAASVLEVPVPDMPACEDTFFVVSYECAANSCTPGGDLTAALEEFGWERVTTADQLQFTTPQSMDFEQKTSLWKRTSSEGFTLPQTMGEVTYFGIFAVPCDADVTPPGPGGAGNAGPTNEPACADFCLSQVV